MNSLPHLMRSTAFRLSIIYMVFFTLVAVGLDGYISKFYFSILVQQTKSELLNEVNKMEAFYQRHGIGALALFIDHRARQPEAFVYLLTDGLGRFLAGNVASIDVDKKFPQQNFLYYRRYAEGQEAPPHKAVAVFLPLSQKMSLLIGRDTGDIENYLKVMHESLFIALGVMLLGGFFIWLLIGRRALRRIDKITRESVKLMQGDLTRRLQVYGSGDEFDRLAINLNHMLDWIEKLTMDLKEVSSNIAHDLRTPLTRLKNRVEQALSYRIMAGNPAASDKDGANLTIERHRAELYRQALEELGAGIDDLMRTFNALLLLSHIEARGAGQDFTLLDVNNLLEEVVDFYKPVADELDVSIAVVLKGRSQIFANRELVLQALFNLVDNALKYGNNGQAGAKIDLCVKETADYVQISVEDNGKGVAESELLHITKRFVRGEKSRTKPGLGIGLSIAKAIMQCHKGNLFLQLSSSATGLRAVLEFPKPE